jgi:hypothetical protein
MEFSQALYETCSAIVRNRKMDWVALEQLQTHVGANQDLPGVSQDYGYNNLWRCGVILMCTMLGVSLREVKYDTGL